MPVAKEIGVTHRPVSLAAGQRVIASDLGWRRLFEQHNWEIAKGNRKQQIACRKDLVRDEI